MRSLLYSLLLVATSLPILVYGQGKVYSPLVNIPGNGANGFEEYISFLYGASISVAALLAVVKIIIAGAKYMMSDVIPAKGEALSDIQGAILGLLLILGAVIILEFINPQLIKREIKFEPIAPPPTINARASAAAVAEQQATALRAGLDSCVYLTPPGASNDGKMMITVANANPCGDKAGDQLVIFAQNCIDGGGKPRASEKGSGMVVCAKPIENGAALAAATRAVSAFSTNMQTRFGANNVTTEGNKITVNIEDGCYDAFKNATSRTAYNSCKAGARNTVQLPCSIQEGVYGRFTGENNSTTVTCELPILVRTVDSFKGYDPKFPNSTPETESEFEKQCTAVGGRYIEDAVTTVFQEPYSPLNDRCVFYN